jgi:hypothetical protein
LDFVAHSLVFPRGHITYDLHTCIMD